MTSGPSVDLEQIRVEARDLLEPPVLFVPVRHHSPTCARHVRDIITSHRPRAVLVEGPPSFDDQIDLLLDEAARMPLAIYSHASFESAPGPEGEPGEPVRTGSYFPLCDYSPEFVALQAGRTVGAELGFVDLDYDQFARWLPSEAGHLDERKYEFSETLRQAATELGCRDHNELWDQLVEGADSTTEDFMAAVLTYGTLARSGSAHAQLVVDGTHQRETAMAELIARWLTPRLGEEDERPIVVVTGAFHTVALPSLVRATLENATGTGPGTPPVDGRLVDRGHGLIRYSFDRLDALRGYGAGMPSPNWYQEVWLSMTSPTVDPANAVIADVATELRREGGDGQPSLPSVVDATVAAERLRRLRARSTVTRTDVIDAMVSCFTKGEDSEQSPVRQAAANRMTGFELGAVPPQTPRVPLARDFDRLIAKYRMPANTSEPKQLQLDVYRSELDRQRSRLLHGLEAIGVHYARCTTPLRFSRASGRDVIRERWIAQLDGATDVSLTEASQWGAAIVEAVAAKTRDELQRLLTGQPSAADLMNVIMNAARRGVLSVVAGGINELRGRVAVEPDLVTVVAALTEVELLWSAREPLGGEAMDALPDLALQLYVRACQLGDRLHDAPDTEWRSLVASLDALHRVLTTDAWTGLDHTSFWEMLARQRRLVRPGLLAGAIAGLQWRAAVVQDTELVQAAAGHLDAGSDGSVGALFLEGLVLVAPDALWEIEGLVEAISSALSDYAPRQFLHRLPGLRSAFSSLTPRQTDRLAESVMELTGARANVRVTGVSENDVMHHASLSEATAERMEADGLSSWLRSGATP